ncbi:hypothetical protein Tco_0496848 [Tanacetum coccineum]
MTAPSTSSTNDANTASPQVIENPNGSNVLHQDLEQIHEDNLEAMDLKCQFSLRAKNRTSFRQYTHKEEMAPMALSDSKVKTCSKTCLTNYETLKKQYDDLNFKLHETKFKAATYKKGLTTVEDQLVTFRKNEVLFSEEVAVLKREASKDLDQLLGSQITDKSKKGLGYSAVPPPHPLIYNRPNKLDLSYSGLDEFKEPEFKGYGPENNKKESNVVCDKESENSKDNSIKSLAEEQVSQDKSGFVESSPNVEKEFFFPVNKKGKPQHDDKGFVDSGCSRHMTRNIAYLLDFKEFDGGYVIFGGGAYGGRITSKGTLKTNNLDFEDLPDENQILLKIPRKDNMYSFDMKNIIPKESLTCLVAKATLDESML